MNNADKKISPQNFVYSKMVVPPSSWSNQCVFFSKHIDEAWFKSVFLKQILLHFNVVDKQLSPFLSFIVYATFIDVL